VGYRTTYVTRYDVVEEWITTEQPEISMMDACFLTNNFGVA